MSPPSKTQHRGNAIEQASETYLQNAGLITIGRNFRTRLGEIDLIMRDRDVLIFVEVRYRQSTKFGTPAETVNKGKQRKLMNTARAFLHRHPEFDQLNCRFDVMSVTKPNYELQYHWIQDAFGNDS